MKFYVYTKKDELKTVTYFIDDLQEFVTKTFNPKTMSFAGVVIEAKDIYAAARAYHFPNEEDETTVAWIPEPTETANHSLIAQSEEQLDLIGHMLRCSVIALKVGKSLQECNRQLAELAHYVRVYNKRNPDIEKEAVFNRLKQRYIEYFERLRYKPFTPDEE